MTSLVKMDEGTCGVCGRTITVLSRYGHPVKGCTGPNPPSYDDDPDSHEFTPWSWATVTYQKSDDALPPIPGEARWR